MATGVIGYTPSASRSPSADDNGCISSLQCSLTTFRHHHRSSERFRTPRTIGKQTIYSPFIANDGAQCRSQFSCSTARPWITIRRLLPQAWRQPSAISIPLFAVRFKALERLEKSLTKLMTLTIPADEGHPKPCCQAFKRWPTTAVNTTELWTHRQTSDDGVL